MKRLLHILFFLLIPVWVLSQNPPTSEITSLNPTLQDYSPPSPEVGAMMKFGDIPISEATGIPNISIPVYSYIHPSNGLKLDISLSYHAGGIKLNEPSSSVGIGWALNAGGIISRNVRGIYDEKPNVGFIYQDILPNESDGNSPAEIVLRPYNNMYNNMLDSQSDIFSYSFGGKSGKFMLGKNNDILILNNSKIKVEKTIGTVAIDGTNLQLIKSFTIIDEDGIKYIFSAYESTTDLGNVVSNKYTSSWHLTKIISPKVNNLSGSINFEYESGSINNYNTGFYVSRYRRVDGFGNEVNTDGSSSQNIMTQFLKKITFPDGVMISFDYDVNGIENVIGRHLNKITITDGQKSKGLLLEQDYSVNRSTLKKVIPFGGKSTNTNTPYTFEYIGSLPDRYSSIPDHWGYYRGTGGSWIPREIFKGGFGYGVYELPGGSRDTDPNNIKNGSLRKITYPTGGYTIFDMEANQAEDNWLNQEFTVTVPGPSFRDRSTMEYLSSSAPYRSVIADIPFEGQSNTNTNMEIIVSSGIGECNGNCKIVVEIYRSSDFSLGNLISVQEIPYSSNGSSKSFSLNNLIEGNVYKAVLYTNGLHDYAAYVTIKWREQTPETSHEEIYRHIQPYVGGLRVKRIMDYDINHSNPVKTKTYEYIMEDGETSSGTLGVYPKYSYTAYYDNKSNPGNGGYYPQIPPPESYVWSTDNIIIRTSSPIFDLSSVHGSTVIYKRVVVRTIADGVSQGKEVKYFTSFADSRPVISSFFPFVPSQIDDWNYGLLKEHIIYDEDNEILKRTVNTYKYSQGLYSQNPTRLENFRSISITPVKFFTGSYEPNNSETPPLGTPIYFLSRSFNPKVSRVDIEKTIDSSFFRGISVVQEKSYTYDSDYFSLKSQKIKTSGGKILNKYYTYPYDELGVVNDPDGVYQKLMNNNELHTIIKEVTKEKETLGSNEEILVSMRTQYEIQGDRVFSKEIQTSKGNISLDTRIQLKRYDNYGNPEELNVVNGPNIVYLWSHNGQYPVAKIENTEYSDVIATGVNLSVLESIGSTENSRTIELNKIRNHATMINAMVTTYTYDPLIGVTSITDPRGVTTRYSYDDFNRLEFIRDETNSLLEQYHYHYQN